MVEAEPDGGGGQKLRVSSAHDVQGEQPEAGRKYEAGGSDMPAEFSQGEAAERRNKKKAERRMTGIRLGMVISRKSVSAAITKQIGGITKMMAAYMADILDPLSCLRQRGEEWQS